MFEFFKKKKKDTWHSELLDAGMPIASELSTPEAFFQNQNFGWERDTGMYRVEHNGEQSPLGLGVTVDYSFQYQEARSRGWKLYYDSTLLQTFVNNYCDWMCGSGLVLQSAPITDIIDMYDKNFDKKKFIQQAETRFRSHMNSRESTHDRSLTGNILFWQAVRSALVGGDELIVLRSRDGYVTFEAIDGGRVRNPDSAEMTRIKERGNFIYEGVEYDKNNTNVAYHVLNADNTYSRIEAYGNKTGRLQAFLLFAKLGRSGDKRGLPAFFASIEDLTNLSRLTSATVKGAVTAASFAISIESDINSTGEKLILNGMKGAMLRAAQLEENGYSEKFANNAAVIGVNNILEPPPGAKVKPLQATTNVDTGAFIEGISVYITASLGIPYEMTVMLFKNSFSASRMSSQSFAQKLIDKRKMYVLNYYLPAYAISIELDALSGKVQADGFLNALLRKDHILIQAYLNCTFTGPKVPQADPLKETKSLAMQLELFGITHEQFADACGGNDFYTNLETIAEEKKDIKKLIPDYYETDDEEEKPKNVKKKDA
jgi:capsid protein